MKLPGRQDFHQRAGGTVPEDLAARPGSRPARSARFALDIAADASAQREIETGTRMRADEAAPASAVHASRRMPLRRGTPRETAATLGVRLSRSNSSPCAIALNWPRGKLLAPHRAHAGIARLQGRSLVERMLARQQLMRDAGQRVHVIPRIRALRARASPGSRKERVSARGDAEARSIAR